MEYDIERIGKLIADIEKYTKELESYKINDAIGFSDSKTYHASSMLVFAILNRLIDLGSEILSVENLGAPNTYQDIMPLLAKANIINKEQADNLNKIIKKRNTLAHFYEDINEKELIKTIKDISAVKSFISTIKKRISSSENKKENKNAKNIP